MKEFCKRYALEEYAFSNLLIALTESCTMFNKIREVSAHGTEPNKVLYRCAQTQNFSKAAQLLNVTQSALSKSISNLESELGVLLFDRFGKKVTLNKSGKKFLEHAVYSIQELDDAVSAALYQDVRPTLYLGLFHYSERFMQCLKDFSVSHSSVTIQIDHLDVSSFNQAPNEYDMLLFPQHPLYRKYKADVVYSDPYFLAVHQSHPLSEKKVVRLNDLVSQNLIFIKYGNGLFDLPYHLCNHSAIGVNGYIHTNSYEMQRWFISNNHGVGFVPQGGASLYVIDPNIVLLPILEEHLNHEVMIGFKREKQLSDIGKQFARYIKDTLLT